jgi:O-antigen/teichoic acid export membrane protein
VAGAAIVSRARRIVGGLGLGYVNLIVVFVAGIWLTRFFIARLGEQRYGLWLIGTQFVGYALLLDLGMVQLLPRQIAFATGREGGWRGARELPMLVGETSRLVLYQTPILALLALSGLFFMPAEWAELRGPLAIVAGTLVLAFPLRIPQAVLSGLQDLSYLGRLQLVAWVVSTAVTVVGVTTGLGLYAFALGYAATQFLPALACVARLKWNYPGVLTFRLPPLGQGRAAAIMRSGAWASVGQVAHILLTGTDLVVIGSLFGPVAVVMYSCTSKILSVTANLPLMILPVAGPALSELRTSVSKERLFKAAQAVGQLIVVISGGIVVVVLGTNEAFVRWWVGPTQYGGTVLTVLLATQLVIRQWNLSVSMTLFSIGRERRTAITALVDGLITVLGLFIFAHAMGPQYAPLGPIAGSVLVTLPSNLAALREEGGSAREYVRGFRSWAWRLLLLAVVATSAAPALRGAGLPMLAVGAAVAGVIYLSFMWTVLVGPPLGEYCLPRITEALLFVRTTLRRGGSGAKA